MKTYQGTFRKLIVWQVAKELTKEVYRIANKFPTEEKYGLSSQMKRASISIMSNLAEGNQRTTDKDALRFFNISFSSLTEVDNQGEVAYELGYVTKKDYEKLVELINKCGYLIFRLVESKKNPNSPKNLNNPKSLNKKGFSLVELMIVITIIAVMSVAGVVGFRGSGDTLVARQVKGIIEDTVKIVELEILGDEYEKSTIHFLSNYLVIVSEPGEISLDLSLGGVSGDCHNIVAGSDGSLIKRDSEGNPIEAVSVKKDETVCIDFINSMETEVRYQIAFGGEQSEVIRFIHFDVKREKPTGVTLGGDDIDSTLEISAPYAKKSFSDGSINLTVIGVEGNKENFEIN